MRIANSRYPAKRVAFYAGAALLIGLGSWPLMRAHAADQPMVMPPMAAVPQTDSSATSAPMAMAPIGQPPIGVQPAMGQQMGMAPASAAPISAGGGQPPNLDIGRSVSSLEDKASDNAKGVIRHLDTSTDAMTLEDLNTARQAVARLDAMIDVEKHLAELDKVRGERSGHSSGSSSIASAIPASVLAPMPVPGIMAVPMKMEPMKPMKAVAVVKEKPKPMYSSLEVARIGGADGKYSAVLKMADGTLKPVVVGDTLPDHMTVRWISPGSVLIEENGETHTLRIKNVNAIYSAMR